MPAPKFIDIDGTRCVWRASATPPRAAGCCKRRAARAVRAEGGLPPRGRASACAESLTMGPAREGRGASFRHGSYRAA